MPIIHRRIRKILPALAVTLCVPLLFAQDQTPGKKDKPANPPPYSNQPATGIAPPPEGTTPHDSPKVDSNKVDTDKKAKKRPGKKKAPAKVEPK